MPQHTSLTIGEEAAARCLSEVLGTIANHETDNMRWLRLASARLREINARAAIIKENE